MPTTLHENRPSAGIGVVEVQKPMVFCAICKVPARPSAGIGVVEVQKPMFFFAISALLARPSAGIGVVEVQKPMFVFCDFCGARATLCGDRRGRGAKTVGFLRFLKFPRDPLRGSAWSRCKNRWFFAISNMLARPSAGIGVVEVQKLEVFFDFCGARAILCGDRRGRGAKTHGFVRFLRCPRNPLRGSAWSRCKNLRFFATFVVRTGPRVLSRFSRACSRAGRSRVLRPFNRDFSRAILLFWLQCRQKVSFSFLVN